HLRQGGVGDPLSLDEQRGLRGRLEREQRPHGAAARTLGCRPERQHQLPRLGVRPALGHGFHVPNLVGVGYYPPWHTSPPPPQAKKTAQYSCKFKSRQGLRKPNARASRPMSTSRSGFRSRSRKGEV